MQNQKACTKEKASEKEGERQNREEHKKRRT
jgi:hypothetical protein